MSDSPTSDGSTGSAQPDGSGGDLRRARATAIVLASSAFMAALDSTVLLTALPRMALDFDVPATMLSTTITIYVLVSAVCLPASAWIARHFGPRRVFMAAIVGFVVSSVGCGLAGSLPVFLLMRALQAASGSLMVPVGQMVLLKVTPKRDLVNVMAIASTPALMAPVLGPALGGFITTFMHWSWVFYINVPIGVLGFIAALKLIPHLEPTKDIPFDLRGFMLAAPMLVLIIGGFDRIGSSAGGWQFGVLMVIGGLATGWLAVRHARRAAHPLVPLTPLKFPCFFMSTISGGTFVRLAFSGTGFVLPLMLQIGMGLSAFHAGLLLLAQNSGDLVLKVIAGRTLKRIGFRNALTSGCVMMSASIAGIAFLPSDTSFSLMMGALFLVGLARSVLFTALQALRFADVPMEEMAGATVLGTMIQSSGMAISISLAALLISLFSGHAAQPDLWSFQAALLVFAAIAAIAAFQFGQLDPDAGAEVTGRRVKRGFKEVTGKTN